jgi:hypothetical protein
MAGLLLLLAMGGHPASSGDNAAFTVKSVSTHLSDTVYFLNGVFSISLPGYMVHAVDQGFELPLAMEVEVFERNNFWFDKRVVLIRQQYKIRYHTLLDVFALIDLNAGSRSYFSTLDDVIARLSVLLNYPLLDNNNLNKEAKYRARIRIGIDQAELPIPLKSSSLWENDWELTSDWFEWDITP